VKLVPTRVTRLEFVIGELQDQARAMAEEDAFDDTNAAQCRAYKVAARELLHAARLVLVTLRTLERVP
jgi:hypothetical protein